MEVLAGVKPEEMDIKPIQPYDKRTCEFLNEWGRVLRSDPRSKQLGDVISFAFYCRKANLIKLREEFAASDYRIGRGVCFHIAPSNIPVNFAFTYIFGILAGNGNIVRVSSKEFEQVDIICEALNQIFQDEKFDRFRRMTSIVRYDHNKDVTDKLSAMCDVRIIWGGDETIRIIRESPLRPRGIEIVFSDRYSVSCISGKAVRELSDEGLYKLVNGFFNDTYLMDQNACSSPQMIYWLDATVEDKDKFWKAVLKTIQGYEMSEYIASEKYTLACDDAIAQHGSGRLKTYGGNKLYVMELPMDFNMKAQDSCLGKFGLFCEQDIMGIDRMLETVDTKVQTCTYFGVDPKMILDRIIGDNITGIDRVVPVGKALDIGVYWDGYDLIRYMSRRIEVV